MMFRFVLVSILLTLVARAVARLFHGIIEGMSGQPASTRTPQRGVPMVRDPVCGTFVLPERAVSLVDGRTRRFFCSNTCRDKYRARTA
jgi:YHS domain-containing protein